MTMNELKQFYEEDEEFHEYVEKFCRNKQKIFPDGALKLKMVQNVAAAYLEKKGKVMR